LFGRVQVVERIKSRLAPDNGPFPTFKGDEPSYAVRPPSDYSRRPTAIVTRCSVRVTANEVEEVQPLAR